MKVELDDVLSGYGGTSRLNANFDAIEAAFERVVFRDGTVPNFLTANLDLNGFNLNNIGAATVDQFRGNAGTITIGSVTSLPEGSPATVDNVGTAGAAVLDFGLPYGPVVQPNFTVATGAPGSSVVISGTYPDKLLTIPRGDVGASGALSDGTYSGIAVSGTGTALNVVNGHITLARMANLAANSFIGNNTGSAATPVALTVAQAKTLLSIGQSDVTNLTSDLALKAALASPTFTGTPAAPTAAQYTSTTQLATTAFVDRLRDVPVLTNPGAARPLVLTDRGCTVPNSTGGWSIPANASVAFPVGSTIWLLNTSGTAQTVSITSDTLRLAGSASTGSRTVALYGLVVLHKTATTEWIISGNVT